jgi:hypothetical protein
VKNILSSSAICVVLVFSSQSVSAQTRQDSNSPSVTSKTGASASKEDNTVTLVGAGDIAGCSNLAGAQATARLIENIPGTVFAAGDLAYEDGTYEEFQKCYQPTWGKFKDRTYPAPGNHEYVTSDSHASGYFQYWGMQAGDPSRGYYSYDLGSWHIIVLNTNCYAKQLGGCGEGSPEESWLRTDLAAHPNACLLAYGHHAMYSSGLVGRHARHTELEPFWADLYAAHADLIIAAHEHSYERFAPQNPYGHLDPNNGIREIVVGTGGRSHTFLGAAQPNSEERNDDTYGVLKLTLLPQKYKWEFIPEPGKSFHDSGEGPCHNAVNRTK